MCKILPSLGAIAKPLLKLPEPFRQLGHPSTSRTAPVKDLSLFFIHLFSVVLFGKAPFFRIGLSSSLWHCLLNYVYASQRTTPNRLLGAFGCVLCFYVVCVYGMQTKAAVCQSRTWKLSCVDIFFGLRRKTQEQEPEKKWVVNVKSVRRMP